MKLEERRYPYIQDLFYLDALTRTTQGFLTPPTTREAKGINNLYELENNNKLKQWFK